MTVEHAVSDLAQALLGLLLGLVGAAAIACYTMVNRRMRERGSRAHWGMGFILGAAGMTLMGAGWTLLCMAGPRLDPRGFRLLGAVLSLVALVLYLASARWVGRWRKPSNYSLALQTGGIYARVRHPQALALAILSVGLGLASGSVPYLVSLPLWIAFWTAYTYLEEKNELIPVFGEEYRRYRERTPRLLPRLRRARRA